MAITLMRQALRRAHRRLCGAEAPAPLQGQRAQETVAELNWQVLEGGCKALTPEGTLDLYEDSREAVLEATTRAEERRLLKTDPRLQAMWRSGRPFLGAHQRMYREADAGKGRRHRLRAAVGRTWEHRGMFHWFGPVPCRCGESRPTQSHLTFDCPLRPDATLEEPEGPCQNEMWLRHPASSAASKRPYLEWESEMSEMATSITQGDYTHIVVATDGGALQNGDRPTSAWSVVARATRGPGGPATVVCAAGEVGGLDGGSYQAEITALMLALRMLGKVHVDRSYTTYIFCDCKSVVDAANLLKAGAMLPRNVPGLWAGARDDMQKLSEFEFERVPAHDRRPGWRAQGVPGTQCARRLNDTADKLCSAAMAPFRAAAERYDNLKKKTLEWATRGLLATAEASRLYMQHARGADSDSELDNQPPGDGDDPAACRLITNMEDSTDHAAPLSTTTMTPRATRTRSRSPRNHRRSSSERQPGRFDDQDEMQGDFKRRRRCHDSAIEQSQEMKSTQLADKHNYVIQCDGVYERFEVREDPPCDTPPASRRHYDDFSEEATNGSLRSSLASASPP